LTSLTRSSASVGSTLTRSRGPAPRPADRRTQRASDHAHAARGRLHRGSNTAPSATGRAAAAAVTPRHSAPARWTGAGTSCVQRGAASLRGTLCWIDEPIVSRCNGHRWAPQRGPADKRSARSANPLLPRPNEALTSAEPGVPRIAIHHRTPGSPARDRLPAGHRPSHKPVYASSSHQRGLYGRQDRSAAHPRQPGVSEPPRHPVGQAEQLRLALRARFAWR
jgi:hypothetical protein